MFGVIWSYRVQPGREEQFEAAYGPEGPWARLFRVAPAYRGVELLRSASDGEYLTIDRWASAADYEKFLKACGDEYARIDRACEALTVQETCVALATSSD